MTSEAVYTVSMATSEIHEGNSLWRIFHADGTEGRGRREEGEGGRGRGREKMRVKVTEDRSDLEEREREGERVWETRRVEPDCRRYT